MVRYNKLFEVKFFHQFYNAFTSKDFDIVPLPNTRSLLISYGIIYKQTNQGFILLYKEENHRLFENLKKVITLNFGIKIKNKYFETFTNVSPSTEKNKYLFSNRRQIDKGKTVDDQISLHSDSFISENNVCLCGYKSSFLSDLLGVGEVLIQKGDDTIFEGELDNTYNTAKIFGDEFGVYDNKSANSEEKKLLYLPDSLFKIFGIIELAIGGDKFNFDDIKGTDYQINFDNRQARWNYFFVCKPDKFYDSVELFLGKEKLPFTSPENVTLINGQQALKVVSQDFLKLRQNYKEETLLAELKSSTESDLVVRKIYLTTPDITRIKGKRENGAEIYFSDMYIYL